MIASVLRVPLTRNMFGVVESRLVLTVVSRNFLIVVAGVPQQVRDMFAEVRMEQQLARLVERLVKFSDHNSSDEKRRAQYMEVLTD